MKVKYEGLKKASDNLPRKQWKNIGHAICRSVIEGVVLIRSMAPVESSSHDLDVGCFKDDIHAKFEKEPNASVDSVVAASPTRDKQFKTVSIGFRRKYKSAKKR